MPCSLGNEIGGAGASPIWFRASRSYRPSRSGSSRITQNIDTDEPNPMARLLMHLMGAFAEFEREMIRDRTLAGVRAARARGKTLGRPQRILRRDEVISMRAAGSSWRAISKQTGVPVFYSPRCSKGHGTLPPCDGNFKF